MNETPDTRDPPRLPLVGDKGEGLELRRFLEEALRIPPGARRFSVTFEQNRPVIVSVDYLPREH